MHLRFRRALVHALTWGISIPFIACSVVGTNTHQQGETAACCYASCADDTEAELRSEVAEARADEALALAEANRYHQRADELKADVKAAKDALDKIPSDRKLYFKIAANTISLGLELHGARQFAKGKQVEKQLGFEVCEYDVRNATMKMKQATKTVWEKPTLKEAGTAAVKMGAGTTIQVLTADGDDWTAKIPVIGAVVTIANSGGQLFGVGELRSATVAFIALLNAQVTSEEKKEAAAQGEADAAKTRATAAQKKLDDYLRNKQAGMCPVDPTTTPDLAQATTTPEARHAVASESADALWMGSGSGSPPPPPPAPGPGSGSGSGSNPTQPTDPGPGSGSGSDPTPPTDPGPGSGSGSDPTPPTDPGPGSGSGSNTCEGDGHSSYLDFDGLSDVEEWDEGNLCDSEGCGGSGAGEYCAIFGCDGGGAGSGS